MKNLILFLVTFVTMLFASCNDLSNRFSNDTAKQIDSTDVVEIISKATNPQFETIKDINTYRSQMITSHYEDSVFISIPDIIFNDVVTVCLNKHNSVSKSSVVKEYANNYDIYVNLHKKINKKEQEPQTIDEILELDVSQGKTDTLINTDNVLLIKTTKKDGK